MIWNLELQISYPENQNSSSNCKYSFNNKVIDFFLDVDTRRRAASDLVRGLCKFHEQRVIEIFSGHVVSMLQVTKIMLWFLKTTEELETERKMGIVCLSHSCSHHSSLFVFLYLSILSTQYSEYTVCVTKSLSNMHTMRVTNHWCL